MHPQAPRESDDSESADDQVMTGDGAVPREGPKPTMTGTGAMVGTDDPDDMVMTGDGAECRDGARPEMTAGGAMVEADEDEPDD